MEKTSRESSQSSKSWQWDIVMKEHEIVIIEKTECEKGPRPWWNIKLDTARVQGATRRQDTDTDSLFDTGGKVPLDWKYANIVPIFKEVKSCKQTTDKSHWLKG